MFFPPTTSLQEEEKQCLRLQTDPWWTEGLVSIKLISCLRAPPLLCSGENKSSACFSAASGEKRDDDARRRNRGRRLEGGVNQQVGGHVYVHVWVVPEDESST